MPIEQGAPLQGRRSRPRRGRAHLLLVRTDDHSADETADSDRTAEAAGPPSTGPWTMWASIERRVRPADAQPGQTVYCSVGPAIGHPRRRGHVVLVPVLVTEDPDGPYRGWLADDAVAPTFIHWPNPASDRAPTPNSDDEQERGSGRAVRLAIEALTDED